MASKTKKIAPEAGKRLPVPAGFVPMASGNFAPLHDFDKEPVLQGKVVEIKVVKTKKGKKLIDTNIMTVSDADGVLSSVWESTALAKTFGEAKKGDEVFFRYEGLIPMKGRNAMKDFSCGLKKAGK
jgi:hypothetical protein